MYVIVVVMLVISGKRRRSNNGGMGADVQMFMTLCICLSYHPPWGGTAEQKIDVIS